MRIECPFCHTQARLSDDKEGAKIRCGGCGKVYRARERGAGERSRSSGPWVIVAVVGVAAILALIAMRSGGGEPARAQAPAPEPAPEPPPRPPVEVDPTGWGSAPVQAAVRFHELARAGNRAALREALAGAEDSALERLTDPDGLVAGWEPYDGEVVSESDGEALVRLSATPVAGGAEKRVVEWHLVRADAEADWGIASFEEWLTDAERRRLERGYDIVKLSDGSVVREREPEPLEHLEDTPPALRERIDELLATMIDLDLTTQASQASRATVEIGKPAIPALLTHLYQNRLESRDDAVRANIVVVALRSITGQSFGYQPQALVGSGLGTTEERRQSAIRQWFAWWYKEGPDFTGLPDPDAGEE